MRTQASYDYDKEMFTDLGVNKNFYYNFLVPRILEINGNKCGSCGNTKNLDIHHSSKKVINIYTLKVLCRKCHMKVHKKGCKQQ